LERPAYSPDEAPSDSHLFPALKQNLGGHSYKDDRDVEAVVTSSLMD
jgi:hypothetical protein